MANKHTVFAYAPEPKPAKRFTYARLYAWMFIMAAAGYCIAAILSHLISQ